MPNPTGTENYIDTARRRNDLFEALKDAEFRRAFADDVGTGLSFQIRALREDRGWTQEELAERMGKRQETVSLWENPDYGKHTLTTVKELAAAFDVAPIVHFGSFYELVDWTIRLTPKQLAPKSFVSDLANLATAVTYTGATGTITVDLGIPPSQLEMPIYPTTGSTFVMATGFATSISGTTKRPQPMGSDEKGSNQYALAA